MKQDLMLMLVVAFLCGLFFKQISGSVFGGRLVEGLTCKTSKDCEPQSCIDGECAWDLFWATCEIDSDECT